MSAAVGDNGPSGLDPVDPAINDWHATRFPDTLSPGSLDCVFVALLGDLPGGWTPSTGAGCPAGRRPVLYLPDYCSLLAAVEQPRIATCSPQRSSGTTRAPGVSASDVRARLNHSFVMAGEVTTVCRHERRLCPSDWARQCLANAIFDGLPHGTRAAGASIIRRPWKTEVADCRFPVFTGVAATLLPDSVSVAGNDFVRDVHTEAHLGHARASLAYLAAGKCRGAM